jgi:hypothetical protein
MRFGPLGIMYSPNSPHTVGTSATLSATEITSTRLRLRKARDADRDGFIELQTDPQVRLHLGGPRPRSAVEQYLDALGAPSTSPGMSPSRAENWN